MHRGLLYWGEWMYRNIYKQTNAGGGAIAFDMTPAAGDIMLIVSAHAENSGTNDLNMAIHDEDDNNVARFLDIPSAATLEGGIPQDVAASVNDLIVVSSAPTETRAVRGDNYFSIFQLGAGAQNDTMTVTIRALLSSSALPVRSVARSTNPADVDGIGVTDGSEGTPTINRIL